MKIGIGSDHTALDMKRAIIEHLEAKGHQLHDYGTHTTDSCDYPVYAGLVARAVRSGECDRGVLICGTGLGMSYAANKLRGIRAACCSEPVSARMATEHNNAQIICFGARIVGEQMGAAIVDAFFDAEFQGDRHQHRLDLIAEIEQAD
ncbi:ribose 5-phosphate isomerase B [Eubacteriales bacterium OttesenSCG-928-N13]|nr:ribose 5-phosphate isomerase B [Eubacteriales bacterium OttesenSCG-928-N13]